MFLSFISPCCYRLENALVLAEEFDSAVKTELRILKEFEDNLRCLGPIAEDLETIGEQLNEHKVCNLNCEFHFGTNLYCRRLLLIMSSIVIVFLFVIFLILTPVVLC